MSKAKRDLNILKCARQEICLKTKVVRDKSKFHKRSERNKNKVKFF